MIDLGRTAIALPCQPDLEDRDRDLHIGDQAEFANPVRERIENLAIDRFVLRLRCDARSGLAGEGVTPSPWIMAGLVAHPSVKPADLSRRRSAFRPASR
jgi:hypothetical protein